MPHRYISRFSWLLGLAAFAALGVSLAVPSVRFGDLVGYVHETVLAAAGFFLFFSGFDILRKKRVIENTPTATVRSAAMGLNEIKGAALQKYSLKTPITAADCVLYKYLVEKEVRRRRSSSWQKVDGGASVQGFYIEDATGKMLVDPTDAELLLRKDYQVVEKKGGLFGSRMRYTEWYLKPGDFVYVIGTVRQCADALLTRKENLAKRLRSLKADAARMQALDTDKDGNVSAQEWDAARAAVEREALDAELRLGQGCEDAIVVARGDTAGEETFLVSDHDEREIITRLSWKGFALVAGGFVLVAVLFVSLFSRAGFVPFRFVIPWESFYR